MQFSDIKYAGNYARSYGAKALIFGPPGSAKTPLVSTAPRPLLLACEAGLLGMRGSQVPTYQAFTTDDIEGFFDWFFRSNESKQFDTLAIDSVSHIAEIYLQDILNGKSKSGNKLHGMAAYGKMAEDVQKHMRRCYMVDQKHIYGIAKEQEVSSQKRPYFPGNVLNVELPHMFDFILHLSKHNVPGKGQLLSFQCNQSIDVLARNRTGNLDDFEPPHFGELIRKALG